MKAALCVIRVRSRLQDNVKAVLVNLHRAARAGARLVVFPEACLTGLVNNDHPGRDLKLGLALRSPVVAGIAGVVCELGIWIGVGMLELARGRLFDTALLISPDGRIALSYRRVTPGWHGPNVDSRFYGHGRTVRVAATPFGRIAFLICGDLFEDRLVMRIQSLKPDIVLIPMSRSFADGRTNRMLWKGEEKPAYVAQMRKLRTTALLVNYISELDGCFGSALAVNAAGDTIADLPPGGAGMVTFGF